MPCLQYIREHGHFVISPNPQTASPKHASLNQQKQCHMGSEGGATVYPCSPCCKFQAEYTHVCIYIYVHIWTYIHVDIYTIYSYIWTHIHMLTHMHLYMHTALKHCFHDKSRPCAVSVLQGIYRITTVFISGPKI